MMPNRHLLPHLSVTISCSSTVPLRSVSLNNTILWRWLVEHGFEMRSTKAVTLNACD